VSKYGQVLQQEVADLLLKIGGVEITEYTTRDRDVAWFSDYLDRCQAFAAQELGVTIG